MLPLKGFYEGENITDLNTAISCQNFFANFLSAITSFEQSYPYILSGGYGHCGSAHLRLPEKFMNAEKPVTNEYYQNRFYLKASNITGQFGTELVELGFNPMGILTDVAVKGDRCCYHLDNGSYDPHNVDSAYEAAALHGIIGEFINDLLKRGSPEGWM